MSKRKEKPSKEDLEKLYDELRCTHKIAKHYGVSHPTICKWMEGYGISRNGNSDAGQLKKLLEEYVRGENE